MPSIKRWYGPDHPRVAEDYVGISQVFALTNREGEAKAALEHALAIQEHTYGHQHSAVALILNQLGILADNHDREDEAEAWCGKLWQLPDRALAGTRQQPISPPL